MKGNAKAGGAAAAGGGGPLRSHYRILLLIFGCCFTFASLLTLLYGSRFPYHFTQTAQSSSAAAAGGGSPDAGLPVPVFEALVHYAMFSNATGRMSDADIRYVAGVLRRRGPCNLLVFGLTAETPLWLALNHGGRTVFLDENEFYIAYLEQRHPGLEAYDVSYTTKVRDFRDLIATARAAADSDCRPVQNLLFSECRLAVNDLPNGLYDVSWDVIIVDGPSGYMPTSPGRMPSIFSAGVMARSSRAATVDVLVHEAQFEVERVSSEEFLCEENRVKPGGGGGPTIALGHYKISGGGRSRSFCGNSTAAAGDGGFEGEAHRRQRAGKGRRRQTPATKNEPQ